MNAPIIYDHNELIVSIAEYKSENKTIVFTNGCFDMLHNGHVLYLEKAKEFGDILLVALNTDQSVRQLKGKDRPIFPLEDRASVISAMRSVDVVTAFSSETPYELVNLVKPDVLVKGGDYSPDSIVGANTVLENGGRVEVVPYIENRSTTALINKIKQL
ncbi:D-glycero-beta-D-manno-heptose 1-phosphate adenylyltransferase [Chlamydiota bacterium]